MKSETMHLLISGHVQGVGYRASLQREATARHIEGWVRNLASGQVEALVCGSPFAIDSLLDWARQGPPGARVDEVGCAPSSAGLPPGYGFQVHPNP